MPREGSDQGGWRLRGISGPGFQDAPAAFPPMRPSPNPAPRSSPSPARQGCSVPGTRAPPAPALLAGRVGSANGSPLVHTPRPALGGAGCVGGCPFSQEAQGRRAPCIAPAPCPVRRGAKLCSRHGTKRTKGVAGGCAGACPSLTALSTFIALSGSLKPGSSLRHLRLCTAAGTELGRPREPPRAQAP